MAYPFKIDWRAALRQRRALEPDGDTQATIQTFADTPADHTDPERRKRLARVLHGDLADPVFQVRVQRLHDYGAGVFVTVNKTDMLGRKTDNIVRVRVALIDADLVKSGVAATYSIFMQNSGLIPTMLIESSSGNFHTYFRVLDCKLEEYEGVQRMLHTRAGTDPLHDLSRVLRLAGAWHRKGNPFQSAIIEDNDRTYTVVELCRLAKRVAPVKPVVDDYQRLVTRAGVVKNIGSRNAARTETGIRLRQLLDKFGLITPAVRAFIAETRDPSDPRGGNRHFAFHSIVASLAAAGWPDSDIRGLVFPLIRARWPQEIDICAADLNASLAWVRQREAATLAAQPAPSERMSALARAFTSRTTGGSQ